MNILYVCSRNKRRSRTAEKIFANDPRFFVKSAGFSAQSPVKLNEKHLLWADIIFVMEYEHSKRLKKLFRNINLPPILVLGIKDHFEFMDKRLIEMLRLKTDEYLSQMTTM
jgi:protein-tyrosine phosphatase